MQENYEKAMLELIELPIEDRIIACGENFGLFAMFYFDNYFKTTNAEFHYTVMEDLQDLAENKINELLVVGFRGCAKTTLAQLWYLWLIAYRKRKYINVDSYDGENAQRTLFELAQIMTTNKEFIHDFGELYVRDFSKNSNTQNRVDNFTTTNGIRVEANTTNVDVRGRKHFETRPDVRGLDDFENLVTKDSALKTKSIYENIVSGMGGLEPGGVMLYLGNYITDHGNVQKLIDRAKGDPKMRVRIIPILENGQPTWPSRYCLSDAEAETTGKQSIESIQRKFGSYTFSYDFMCMPVDEKTSEFKSEYFQHATEQEVKHLNTLTYITIDSAVKESETADYTGITINKVSEDNKWYITTYQEKMNSKKLIDHIFELWERHRPELIGLEETTFTIAIKPFIDEEMRKRNKYITFKLLKHNKTNKVTRIRGLIPRHESRSIFLVGDNIALKDEARAFPNGAHDDILDSLAYQIGVAQRPFPEYDTSLQQQNNRSRQNIAR